MTMTPVTAATGDPLCRAAASQLVLVDIQEKLGAAMPAKVVNRVVLNTKLLLRTANLLGVPVSYSEQYPAGLGPTEPSVAESLPKAAKYFSKTAFSCAGAEGFLDHLSASGRPQVVLAGMEAHVCVLQTAIDLHRAGYQVHVVEDGVCSRKLENYQNALERLRQLGVTVTSTESVVFEWLENSKHEHFKAISQHVR